MVKMVIVRMLLNVAFGLLIISPEAFTKKLNTLQEIDGLRKNGTHISKEIELLSKLNKIFADGHKALQIVTDFDNTLTTDRDIVIKDIPVLNSFEMFRKCPSVPQSYKDEEYQLYMRYSPIENDPHKSKEEISEHLVQWYRAANNLMKGLKFPRAELKDIARTQTGYFRQGIGELISWIDIKKVPILVLSSGLGEAVVNTLEAANLTSPQLKVISNFLELDSEDFIIGMKGSPIHSLNKNEASIKDTEYYDTIKEKSNVILMGDTIGDANMVDGFENLDAVIKIGYLSNKRKTRLSDYLDYFDIVLQNDQTMDVINDIIKHFQDYNRLLFNIITYFIGTFLGFRTLKGKKESLGIGSLRCPSVCLSRPFIYLTYSIGTSRVD